MADEVVAGVDVGSSGARAVAITREGAVVASAASSHPMRDLPLGEVDAAVLLRSAVDAVAGLGVHPQAIGIGGQGPTTVASTGERALSFRHPAGTEGGMAGQEEGQAEALRDLISGPFEPRQLWDWLAARMGGRSDLQSVWPGSQPHAGFGDPVPVGTPFGLTPEGPLPAGIPVVPGCNDAFMTAWASGVDTPGKAFDPGGTTGGLGVAVAAAEHPEVAAFGMAAHVAGVAIVGGPVAAHGAMMSWWSEVTGRSVPDLIAEAEDVPPGAHGVLVLPFFEGERAPRWNPDLRAEVLGLHLDHGRPVVTRALLESAAYGLAHIARTLAARGVGLDRVVCSGGPARSRLWTAIKADVLEVPVDIPDCDQMAAYGAALVAGSGAGWWPRPGEGTAGDWPTPVMTVIDPHPLDVYRKNVDRFIAFGDEAERRTT